MSTRKPWPWCEIPWAEVHAACRAGGYDPGTPAQRRAFLDGLPPGVTVEDDNETCWKMAGRWFSEFGQVTEREVEDWCADEACWPVEVIADDLRAWAVAAMERCRVLQAQLDSERRHADELVQRINDVTEALGPYRTPGRPLAEDVRGLAHFDSAVRDFRDCEDKLMTARSELAKARQERDETRAAPPSSSRTA